MALNRNILLCLLVLVLAACSKGLESEEDTNGVPANLTISFSSLGLSADSRGLNDPNSDPATWTAMERAIDGREIYHLTLFLVDSKGTLVGYRDIAKGKGDIDADNGFWNGYKVEQTKAVGTRVKVTFNYDAPKHGQIEKLVQGQYKLYVVANYSAYKTYEGLGGTAATGFTSIVDGIITDFNNNSNTGISNVKSAKTNFFNYQISSRADFVCPKHPQPLTLVKEISLLPGENHITGELKRTYARIRIQLANDSERFNLSVSSLSFNNAFAQNRTFLFDDPDTPDRVYDLASLGKGAAKGAPAANSKGSIIPFKAIELQPKTQEVLYDAYILGSKGAETDYSYTLNVKYQGAQKIAYTYKVDRTPISNPNKVNASEANTAYLFRNQNNQYRFLTAGTTTMETGPSVSKNTVVNVDNVFQEVENGTGLAYIWKLEPKVGQFYVVNLSNFMYMGQAASPGDVLPLQSHKNAPTFKLVSGYGGQNICFSYDSGGKTLYTNVNGGYQDLVIAWDEPGDGSQFKFYKVNITKTTKPTDIVYNKPIPLQTIDPITSVVRPVTNIQRNDFIKIYASANYNINNSTFDFKVEPWKKKDSGIKFN